MARQPRFFVPGEVLHVIQRGNNREPIFAAPNDLRFFLSCLANACRAHGLLVHSYVLMTNHLHLLPTPRNKESLPRTMQSVGRRYVQYFNTVYERTGTLWEGRYRATVVDSEQYLLTCMRYIELNPVRAGLVRHPGEYRWSSYHANADGSPDDLVEAHEVYRRLGQSEEHRRSIYRQLFDTELHDVEVDTIRQATNRNWALGNDRFKERIEALSGRRSDPLRKGRPFKASGPINRV
jgi:putative transposase